VYKEARRGEILDAGRLSKNTVVNQVRSLLLYTLLHKLLILWNYAFSSTATYQISNDSLSFTDEWQWLICFLLYFKTHHYTKGLNSPLFGTCFLTSSHSPRLQYSIHSQFLRSLPGPCHQLWYSNSRYAPNFSPFELTLIYSHYTISCSHWNLKSIDPLPCYPPFSHLHSSSYPVCIWWSTISSNLLPIS